MKRTFDESDYLADPHTAVALAVAERFPAGTTPIVTLATAHPAKFPDAVEAATGMKPATPPEIAALAGREERFTVLANDLAALERHVETHARAAPQEA